MPSSARLAKALNKSAPRHGIHRRIESGYWHHLRSGSSIALDAQREFVVGRRCRPTPGASVSWHQHIVFSKPKSVGRKLPALGTTTLELTGKRRNDAGLPLCKIAKLSLGHSSEKRLKRSD